MPGDNNKMSDSQKLACKIVVGGAVTGLGVITQNPGLLANSRNIANQVCTQYEKEIHSIMTAPEIYDRMHPNPVYVKPSGGIEVFCELI
ncbi:MAG: hypothetical protein U1E31_00215 [Rickettsiales bacterium]